MHRSLLSLLALSVICCSATTGVKPTGQVDPQSACPAGRLAWNLQVSDQRADREDSARVIELVRDSIIRSFPGCRWAGESGAGTIAIEIHRFAAKLDGSIWDAAAEWTVLARDAGGRTMTEFDSDSELSRPNYRNEDNERAALQQVLEEAMQRTLTGLRALSSGP